MGSLLVRDELHLLEWLARGGLTASFLKSFIFSSGWLRVGSLLVHEKIHLLEWLASGGLTASS